MKYRKKWVYPMGTDLLHDPMLNKGTAFTTDERDALKLQGLLPPRIFTQGEQEQRVLENFRRKATDLERYIFLNALHDRNERLFYRVVTNNIKEMMPVIYTPVVGEACKQFAHIFRRPRGLYISIDDRGKIGDVLKNWPEQDVRVIVVTDGERILGLGDLGANGMGIPIGKLSLYTVCAGIDPAACLPITLDVGTDNEELLNDPLYIGTPQKRIRGREYDEFIEEFIDAVTNLYPNLLLQFEDFGKQNAFRLLEKYRDRLCTFNDDIQGTGSVALAGIISALRITDEKLTDQTVLFAGAGEAGVGIANILASAMVKNGLSPEDARKRCWFMDSKGLVVQSRDDLEEHKAPYAHTHAFLTDIASAVKDLKPTALIGASAQPGLFTPEVLKLMAEINEHPIVFALSNPTSKAECTAQQACEGTDGRVIFASGSPFQPVEYKGETIVTGQGNNAYIFPGLGLGAVVCSATKITDEMFFAAAEALAAEVDEDTLSQGCIYPPVTRMRELSKAIALRVVQTACSQGVAQRADLDDPEKYIDAMMFDPSY